MGSNREKFNIAMAILVKLPFLKGTKNYFAFDGSNNIFACYIEYVVLLINYFPWPLLENIDFKF